MMYFLSVTNRQNHLKNLQAFVVVYGEKMPAGIITIVIFK